LLQKRAADDGPAWDRRRDEGFGTKIPPEPDTKSAEIGCGKGKKEVGQRIKDRTSEGGRKSH